MRGFSAFFGKEMLEIRKTWRMWVLPLIMAFVGLTSPIIAKVTPDLISSLMADQPGMMVILPEPTTMDAYLQFMKNATQLVLIAVIISVAGMMVSEKRSGTAVMVLTKPISRTAMLLAKVLSNWVLLLCSTLLGAALCVGMTFVVFDTAHAVDFLVAVGAWYLLAAMFIAVMALLSVLIPSQGGVAGAGVVFYFVVAVLSGWDVTRKYTPAGLMNAGDLVLPDGNVELLWPALTALGVILVAVVVAAMVFERQEI